MKSHPITPTCTLTDLLKLVNEEKGRIESIQENFTAQLSEVLDSIDFLSRLIVQIMESPVTQNDQQSKLEKYRHFSSGITDKREKEVFYSLLNYKENQARAEDIANELGKHRSTVSQYLNKLYKKNYVKKSQIGHEIFFSIVYNPEVLECPGENEEA